MFIPGKDARALEGMANMLFGVLMGMLLASVAGESHLWFARTEIVVAAVYLLLQIAYLVAWHRARRETKLASEGMK